MQIFPSNHVIANQADDVYLRVGDKSKKLNFEQRLQLVYAKGIKYFEDQPVAGATLKDINLDFVTKYCKKIGYTKGDAEFYLRHNNEFITTSDNEDKISAAAILLFGTNPQKFFPRARVRFVRYEGTLHTVTTVSWIPIFRLRCLMTTLWLRVREHFPALFASTTLENITSLATLKL